MQSLPRPAWFKRSANLSYAVATLAVAAAVLANLLMGTYLHAPPTLFSFLSAIIFAAWLGGAGPGLASTVLSILVFDYFFLPPIYSIDLLLSDMPRIVLFATSGLIVVGLNAAQRNTAESLRRSRSDLEDKVQDLETLNAALRESEARLAEVERELRLTIDRIPTLAWHTRPDGYAEYLNKRWLDYCGLSLDQALGWQWQITIHPEDLPKLLDSWREILEAGKPAEVEARMRRFDGEYRWFLFRPEPLHDDFGNIVRWYGTNTDIEDRKRAEDALRQSQAYLAEAQRLSHCGSFGWNIPSGELLWSEESYRIFEYDPRTKTTIEMVFNRVHPDDAALVRQVIERATSNKKAFDFEHRLLMPNGSVKHLNVVAHPFADETGGLQFVGAVMDITARKLADDALRQSEAYLAEALGIANIGYWERFPATKRITWSEEAFRIFGLPRGDGTLTFARYHELVHPEDLQKMITAQIETERLRVGDKYDVEYRAVRPNGEVRFLHSRGNVTKDESGQVRRMFGIVEDITERKLAEAALLERAALLDLSHDSIFVRSMDDAISFWNRGAEQLYGWSKEQALGQVTHQLLQTIFPAPVEKITSELLSTGRWEGEIVHTKRDGTQVTVASRWSLRQDEHGRPVGILETNNDITERKRAEESLRNSEQRYRHLFHNMPIGLWQIDASELVERFDRLRAEGITELGPYIDQHPDLLQEFSNAVKIKEVNEHMVKLLGAHDTSEILAFERFRHINPDTFRRGLESRWRGEPTHQQEAKIETLDGRVIDVLMTATRPGLVADFETSVMGIIDITERVRAQEMLQRVQADFAHAARVSMLGELTASIAHEINQPLAAIVTNSEVGLRLLNRSTPDPVEMQEIVNCIVNDARRATDIIARVRMMATRQASEQTWLLVDEVIREALLFLRHEVQSHGLAVTHHLDPAAQKVLGDRTQLQQVFVNLTVNAIQAMTEAETAQRILVIRTAPAGPDALNCTVEDSGPGINPHHLDRLFDSFFTTKGSGMGLGLAISRSIIEAHGGYIRADNQSALGGARFRFTLPTKAN